MNLKRHVMNLAVDHISMTAARREICEPEVVEYIVSELFKFLGVQEFSCSSQLRNVTSKEDFREQLNRIVGGKLTRAIADRLAHSSIKPKPPNEYWFDGEYDKNSIKDPFSDFAWRVTASTLMMTSLPDLPIETTVTRDRHEIS